MIKTSSSIILLILLPNSRAQDSGQTILVVSSGIEVELNLEWTSLRERMALGLFKPQSCLNACKKVRAI